MQLWGLTSPKCVGQAGRQKFHAQISSVVLKQTSFFSKKP